jgi:hypothetical protein
MPTPAQAPKYAGGHACQETPKGWRVAFAPRGTPGLKAQLQKETRAVFHTITRIQFCPWCSKKLPI